MLQHLCNSDTNVQHVQTCQKKLKKGQTLGEKYLFPSMLFSFMCVYSSHPKVFKNAIKNKNADFFLKVIVTNYNVVRILQHFGLLSTCCPHVYDISN